LGSFAIGAGMYAHVVNFSLKMKGGYSYAILALMSWEQVKKYSPLFLEKGLIFQRTKLCLGRGKGG